jgi:hypothetical protein
MLHRSSLAQGIVTESRGPQEPGHSRLDSPRHEGEFVAGVAVVRKRGGSAAPPHVPGDSVIGECCRGSSNSERRLR